MLGENKVSAPQTELVASQINQNHSKMNAEISNRGEQTSKKNLIVLQNDNSNSKSELETSESEKKDTDDSKSEISESEEKSELEQNQSFVMENLNNKKLSNKGKKQEIFWANENPFTTGKGKSKSKSKSHKERRLAKIIKTNPLVNGAIVEKYIYTIEKNSIL